jgi:hypothetical protein
MNMYFYGGDLLTCLFYASPLGKFEITCASLTMSCHSAEKTRSWPYHGPPGQDLSAYPTILNVPYQLLRDNDEDLQN